MLLMLVCDGAATKRLNFCDIHVQTLQECVEVTAYRTRILLQTNMAAAELDKFSSRVRYGSAIVSYIVTSCKTCVVGKC